MKEVVWSGGGPLDEDQFFKLAAEYGTTGPEDQTRISVYWQRTDGEQSGLDEFFEWDLTEEGKMEFVIKIMRPVQPQAGIPKVTDDLAGLNELYEWVVGHPQWYDDVRIMIEIEA